VINPHVIIDVDDQKRKVVSKGKMAAKEGKNDNTESEMKTSYKWNYKRNADSGYVDGCC
jgi:hypothetical protein